MSRSSTRLSVAGIMSLAAVLLLIWPSTVPGLHGDEAWVILRAKDIAAGARSLDGMNYYTGALYPYVLCAAMELFGFDIAVARVLSGVLNLGTLALIMQITRRLHPLANVWLWTGLLTATCVPLVLCSRFATEITALGPVLVFGGVALSQRAWNGARGARRSCAFATAGGFVLGLAIYNHMATAGIVAGLGLGLLVALGLGGLRDLRSYALAAGFAIGVAPRLLQIARLPANGVPDSPLKRLGDNLASGLLSEFLETPRIYFGMIDGDLLVQRFAGIELVAMVPFFSVTLAALIIARFASGPASLARRDRALLVALAAAIAITTLMAPWLALRYYLIPALGAPYLLVRLALSCMQAPLAARWTRTVGLCALILIPATQFFYVGVNYLYSHRLSGGHLGVFPLGSRLMETSNHFVRSDTLYAQLVEAGVETVFADSLLGWPLAYYDLDAGRLRLGGHAGAEWLPSHGVSARVLYNGPTPVNGGRVLDPRGHKVVTLNGVRFELVEGFDPHFAVFIYRP
jgi:hypothetical protein